MTEASSTFFEDPDHAAKYISFADESFSWRHIEQPAFKDYLKDCVSSDSRILDIGCGAGRIIRHFVGQGIPEDQITGIDRSAAMIRLAESIVPKATLIECRASDMEFDNDSFNLVVANMVFHMMDEDELKVTTQRIGEVLTTGGYFFFVDDNPLCDHGNRLIKQWTYVRSPWGEEFRVFNHDVNEFLRETAPMNGLEMVSSSYPEIDEAGQDEPEECERYSSRQSRVAALLCKID